MTRMKSKSPMEKDLYEEQQFPSGLLTGICFNIASKKDTVSILMNLFFLKKYSRSFL